MKKILVIAVSGLLVGGLFALYMFSDIKESVASVIEEVNTVTAFQVGVFSNLDNAKKASESHAGSYIYHDGDKYRVFLAVYKDEEIVNYLDNYYKKENIITYKKQIDVDTEFLEELDKYEKLLKKTSDEANYVTANKSILEALDKYI